MPMHLGLQVGCKSLIYSQSLSNHMKLHKPAHSYLQSSFEVPMATPHGRDCILDTWQLIHIYGCLQHMTVYDIL